MPKLDYQRHEQFCKCMALGVNTASECYEAAGYPRDRVAAQHLAKTEKIAARIREIEMDNANPS